MPTGNSTSSPRSAEAVFGLKSRNQRAEWISRSGKPHPLVADLMAESKAPDRRKYKRIATDQVISFAPVDRRDVLGVSRNVSSGGIRFEAVGCEINMGDVLRVTFNVDEQTVVATGHVVWATEMDPLTTDVGIEFLEIDPEALRILEDMMGVEIP